MSCKRSACWPGDISIDYISTQVCVLVYYIIIIRIGDALPLRSVSHMHLSVGEDIIFAEKKQVIIIIIIMWGW